MENVEKSINRLTGQFREDGFEVLSGPRTTGDGYYESCIVGFEEIRLRLLFDLIAR